MLIKNIRNNTPKWVTGKAIAMTGPLSCKVEIDGVVHRRHVDRMLPAKAQVVITNQSTEDVFIPTPVISSIPERLSEQAIRRNPPEIEDLLII